MQNWQKITLQAQKLLTVCLAKAIDHALSARLGKEWFSEFANADAKEKPSNRIVKSNQTSTANMDLQALLKFLRHRSKYANHVLHYFGFYQGLDSYAADDQLRQFHDLLSRLINDFRNSMDAHPSAGEIEKDLSGQHRLRIYDHEQAYQDMCRLSQLFYDITDSTGASYHQQILNLSRKKKRLPLLAAGAAALLILGAALWLWLRPGENVYRDDRKPLIVQAQVTVQPFEIYYDGDGLVADCYVTNGTEQTVSGLSISQFCLYDGQNQIAAAQFRDLEDLSIGPGSHVKWRFRFPAGTVFSYDADLSSLYPQIHCELP